jgi:hypothetical protein
MPNKKARQIQIFVEDNEPGFVINLDDITPKTLFADSGQETKTLELTPEKEKAVLNDIYRRINSQLGRVEDLNDDRLLAIVSALLIENAIENFLQSVFPGFKELNKRSEFTFSMKIQVAKALHYIPFKIFNNADVIRGIRNKFAHNLEFETLSSLGTKTVQGLRDRASSYHPSIGEHENPSEMFKEFTYCTASAIYYFTVLSEFLSEFVRSEEDFHGPFQEFLNSKYGA